MHYNCCAPSFLNIIQNLPITGATMKHPRKDTWGEERVVVLFEEICGAVVSLLSTTYTSVLGYIISMPATWVDRSSSRDDAAKYKELQHFILFKGYLYNKSFFDFCHVSGASYASVPSSIFVYFKRDSSRVHDLARLVLVYRY
jgi:hypothetical protein